MLLSISVWLWCIALLYICSHIVRCQRRHTTRCRWLAWAITILIQQSTYLPTHIQYHAADIAIAAAARAAPVVTTCHQSMTSCRWGQHLITDEHRARPIRRDNRRHDNHTRPAAETTNTRNISVTWNQLPSSFRQPHSVHSPPGSPHPEHITSSHDHSHHLRSHHLSHARPFTPDLKLISFTNPFRHSHSYSFQTDFTDLNLYWIKGALFVCFSFFFFSHFFSGYVC